MNPRDHSKLDYFVRMVKRPYVKTGRVCLGLEIGEITLGLNRDWVNLRGNSLDLKIRMKLWTENEIRLR
jgi:hypothetical protein